MKRKVWTVEEIKARRTRRDRIDARAEALNRQTGAAMTAPSCCNGSDPACPAHGIAASNARQNDYWKRVGGHPDVGEVDHD